MSKLGGGTFGTGAMSAGVNQLVMNELKNIKDPALMQWASAIVGAAAAKIVNGNAQTGASIAASETKNNYLSHEQYRQYQSQLKDLKEKLENGSITQEEYNAAVNGVVSYWAEKDIEQNKQWLAEHHIDAVLIDDESGRIALEKEQYQQMLSELSNSKNDEETAAIKKKWRKISDEQIDKWSKIGNNLGQNLDGSNSYLYPDLSTEVVKLNDKVSSNDLLAKIQNQLSNGYQSVTQLKDDVIAYKEQKDIEYAKNQLAVQGITPDDPEYSSKLADEYRKAKEQSDAVLGLAVGEGAGELVSVLSKLKVFKYAASTIEEASHSTNLIKFKGDEAVIHFERHGKQIMNALGKNEYNLKNYIEDANHVIQTGTYVPELNGYVQLIGGKGSAKYAFVGLDRLTGNITTFHIKTVGELAKKAPSLGLIP